MVVTIPSSASSTAFPSSREKTLGNWCAGGRRSRVIALSVCLRDSARLAWGLPARNLPPCGARSLSGAPALAGPCTFGTHLRVLQSFLRPRFAYAAFSLLWRCGQAALPFARALHASRRPHRNIDSATIRPDAASINNYFAQRYALPLQCRNAAQCCDRVAPAMPRNVATGAPSQWLRDAYECDPGVVPVLDWRQRKRNAKERERYEQVRQTVGIRGNPGGR